MNAAGLPLKAFKLFLVNVGLLGCMAGLRQLTLLDGNNLFTEFKGALTEHKMAERIGRRFGWKCYEIYADWIPLEHILDRKHYRSVHYIVNYRGTYIEIQIRTLFEEGWGEIDHDILYPLQKDNPMLLEFSELLNRLSGMGDEVGSYYHRLQDVPEQSFKGKKTAVAKLLGGKLHFSNHGGLADAGNIRTFQDTIDSVVKE